MLNLVDKIYKIADKKFENDTLENDFTDGLSGVYWSYFQEHGHPLFSNEFRMNDQNRYSIPNSINDKLLECDDLSDYILSSVQASQKQKIGIRGMLFWAMTVQDSLTEQQPNVFDSYEYNLNDYIPVLSLYNIKPISLQELIEITDKLEKIDNLLDKTKIDNSVIEKEVNIYDLFKKNIQAGDSFTDPNFVEWEIEYGDYGNPNMPFIYKIDFYGSGYDVFKKK